MTTRRSAQMYPEDFWHIDCFLTVLEQYLFKLQWQQAHPKHRRLPATTIKPHRPVVRHMRSVNRNS